MMEARWRRYQPCGDSNMPASLVHLAGWLMIGVGGAVLFAAFPGETNVALLPEFIVRVGTPFAVVYTAFQAALVPYFRKSRVLWLVIGLFAVGAILGAIGRAIDIDGFCARHGISYTQYVLCGASCVSGVGFGIAIVRGWVYEAD
jgi:hypothetical protein